MNRGQILVVGAIVPFLLFAVTTGSPVLLMLAPVLVVGSLATRLGTGRGLADTRWSTPATVPAPADGPVLAPPCSPFATVRALARVEGRQLLWSPWFAMGLGFCLVITLLFGVLWGVENSESWAEGVQYFPWFLHPLVGLTVLASHRATTRAQRDDTDEVFGVCPAAPETRTMGLVASSWLAVLAGSVFLVVFASVLAGRAPAAHGSLSADSMGDLLGALLLCVGGVALGVALGRWVRFALAPVVIVVAIAFATTALNGIGGHGWNPYTNLATAPTVEAPSPVFADRPVWSHVLWIAALTALVAVIAVLRHRRDRPTVLAGVGCAAIAVVAAFGATAEMSPASAQRIADRVAHPEAHQECADVAGRAQICMFDLHSEVIEWIAVDTEAVAAALPPQVEPLVMRQIYENRIDQLPPEVRRRLPDVLPDRPEDELPVTTDLDEFGTFTGVGRDLALAAVGLPTRPNEELIPTIVAGQARGVVALWLSVRGLDPAEQLRRTTISDLDPSESDSYARGSLGGVGVCSVPGVVWSGQDLAAARAVMGIDEAVVAGVIETQWEQWIDPATGTDELLAALGLPAEGPFDVVTPRPGQGC